MTNIYSNNIMSNRNELVRRLLSGITMSELQYLVNIREEANRPIPPLRRRRRQQEPRRNVRQLIQYFEDNPIPPHRPIPAPRIKKQQLVPAPRTRINQKRTALNGYTKSFEISLKSNRDALVHLQNTRVAISRLFETILNNTKGFQFVETLKVSFTKRKDDANIYKPAYFNSRAQIVSNPNNFIPSFQLSQRQLLNGIAVWLSEGSGWVINCIDKHLINTVVYDPLKGNSYIPLPSELRNSSSGLVNIKNEDDKCFRWCHIRYLNPQKKDPSGLKNRTRDWQKS